jgi:hypothetical protein
MGLKLEILASIIGVVTKANDLTSVESKVNKGKKLKLVTGTGSGQADLHFADTRTLTASSSEDLDLAGGLTDPFGAALTFVKIKAILIVAAAGNANDVVIGGAASNAFVGPFADATDKIKVHPGGTLLLSDPVGWTVTAATSDLLKVANGGSGTPVTYDIILVGASA